MRLYTNSRLARGLCAALFLCCLFACSLPLAPAYDKAVNEALNVANIETMTLLASVNAGVQQSDFAARAERYAQVIGKLEALSIAANARPVPKHASADKINAALDRLIPASASVGDVRLPSVYAIRKISEAISKMRDTDKKQGLSAYEVLAFKQEVSIYFDQALTYENFLQR